MREPVDPRGVAQGRDVEPADAAGAASRRAVLGADGADLLGEVSVDLGGVGPGPDARGVGLGDADDAAADLGRGEAQAGDDAAVVFLLFGGECGEKVVVVVFF